MNTIEVKKRTFKTAIFCYILFLSYSSSQAQYENLQFRHLTVDDGLAQSVVNSIFKDSRGYVWMSTYSGISRFDGIRVLSNEEIAPGAGSISQSATVFEDSKGNIWIGSVEALIKFDYTTNKFYKYNRSSKVGLEGTKRKGYYFPYAERDGKIICSTMAFPVYYIFDTIDETFLEFDVSINKSTNLVVPEVIPQVAGLFKDIFLYVWYDEKKGTAITTMAESSGKGLYWKTIYVKGHYGDLMGANKYGDIMYIIFRQSNSNPEKSTSAIYLYNFRTGKVDFIYHLDYPINGLTENDGNLYVASINSGIHIIDLKTMTEKGNIRHHPKMPSSLMTNYSTYVYIFDDQLWVSSWGKGVDYTYLSPQMFHQHLSAHEATQNKTDNFIRGIVEDENGHFWCNTLSKGIIQLNEKLEYLSTIKGTETIQSASIYIDKEQNLYFGDKVLLKYNIKNKKLQSFDHKRRDFKNSLQSNDFQYFTCDKKDKILAASMSGVFEIDGMNNQIHPLNNDCNEFTELQQFVYKDRHDRLYAFSSFHGLNVFQEKNGYAEKIYSFEKAFIPRHAYEQNDSIIWFGTTSGLIKYNSKRNTEIWFTTSNGLPDNTIYAIAPDPYGRLWLSTNRGISTMDIASEKFKNYFNSLGQQSLEYNRHSVCITKDGRILFGGINGITSINPSVVDVTSRRPLLEFTAVQSEIEINPYGHEKASETKILPAGTTFIEFQFKAIDYFKSKELQLHYKLDGIGTKWESVQNPGYARYINLKPGKYVFKVVEGGKDDLQTQKAKTFYFEIAKFWWQTLVFKILMVGLLLFMVYFVLQLWIKQKLSAEKHTLEKQLVILKEQERISSDLHDDIGSTLSSISIYSELADKYYQTFPEKSQDMIQKISKQSKELMSRIEDIIWSLKPNTEHNISIKKKIQEIALESLALKNILFTLEVDENTDHLVTEPELRKNIVLIIKEALHNIAKYSEATEAKISIQYEQKNIVLSISDNGIGFDQNNIKKGNGLGNMKKRTSDVNGICSIQTATGSGTIITCRIPIARFRY
ncbi:MAG: hypothetical protein KA536_13990 [Saprospiraceae bacterium]|nr:hypothetical protein [Saprospiraceae bacterium]